MTREGALLVMIAVAVVLLALGAIAWRRRTRRDAAFEAPVGEIPAGAEVRAAQSGLYVATTRHGEPLERLAIRKAGRGQGHGDRLLEFMLAAARERGFRKYKLHGQARLRAFYEKHGFRAEGEPFLEAGIPHLLLRKED